MGSGFDTSLIESIKRTEIQFSALLRSRDMERNSRKLIRMLERDGWVLDRINGDHHTYKHPKRDVIITVTHPKRDLPIGLVRHIYKLAGWRA